MDCARNTKVWLLTITFCFFSLACSSHSDNSPKVYQPSNDPMADVQLAINSAKTNDKNLIIVMGAQWCHDSRGLASKFASDELRPILDSHYEVVYVDVDYYKDLRNITTRFSLAHYFATPTVMLVNPKTEELLNADTMHIWGAADSVSMADYKAYFTKYANVSTPPSLNISIEHKQQIETFKTYHGNRLQAAYEKLVPAMKKEDNTGEADENFYKHWKEVRQYRMALQKDIQALYQSAHSNPQQSLILPEYDAFSWEE